MSCFLKYLLKSFFPYKIYFFVSFLWVAVCILKCFRVATEVFINYYRDIQITNANAYIKSLMNIIMKSLKKATLISIVTLSFFFPFFSFQIPRFIYGRIEESFPFLNWMEIKLKFSSFFFFFFDQSWAVSVFVCWYVHMNKKERKQFWLTQDQMNLEKGFFIRRRDYAACVQVQCQKMDSHFKSLNWDFIMSNKKSNM